MAYTTINKPSLYFDTKLYVANEQQRDITGFEFNPDWVWIHNRTQSVNSMLFDKVRGATKQIHTNNNSAENTDAQALNAFITNGFSLGTGWTNQSTGDNYVAWNWSAGNSSGSSNADGSVTSTVSANTTAGFSIVTFTGTGSAATIGHGLGAVPNLIIVKKTSATGNWGVYHSGLGATKYLLFNAYDSAGTSSAPWNDTSPTSSVFTVNTSSDVNASGATHVAYCFKSIKGYSKIGTYAGNGNTDGPFIYTGFKPAMLWFKRTSGSVANYQMWDNKRDPDNPVENAYHIDSNDADGSPDQDIDFLSSGFKIRSNQGHLNANGYDFVYYAVAEEPLVANVGAKGIPATAR